MIISPFSRWVNRGTERSKETCRVRSRAGIQSQFYLTLGPEYFPMSYAIGKSLTSLVIKDLTVKRYRNGNAKEW